MTSNDLKTTIQEDMKNALRTGDKEKLATIRLILASIKQREIDERVVLSNGQIVSVLDKMIKQRRESIAQFESANRLELAAKEKAEIEVIQAYLPPQLPEDEVIALIDAAIAANGATSARDMGKVMATLKLQLLGRADMARVGLLIKARFSE